MSLALEAKRVEHATLEENGSHSGGVETYRRRGSGGGQQRSGDVPTSSEVSQNTARREVCKKKSPRCLSTLFHARHAR